MSIAAKHEAAEAAADSPALACAAKMADKLMAWSQGDPASIVGDYIDKWQDNIRREHLILSGCRDQEAYNGEISRDHRKEVISWMCEASDTFRLQRRTFHMAVNYFDAYMAVHSCKVRLGKIQLLASFCLFEAAKIKESDGHPELSAFVEAAVDDPTTDADRAQWLADLSTQFARFEAKLVTLLGGDLLIPLAIDQLWGCFERYRMLDACKRRVVFAEFDMNWHRYINSEFFSQAASLLDHAVCDVESLKFSNSQLASSAFYLAVMTRGSLFEVPRYPDDVQLVTGFTLVELVECVIFMDRFSISHITKLVNARRTVLNDQQSVLGHDPIDILYRQVYPFEIVPEYVQDDEQDDFGNG
ncbi:hypothetical protein BC831DRAFT_502617 [Entophlyctis helioformis]|nr:hypothetical protein BC831DRAFT_502617 [Entophlyctis helioformis]